MLFCLMSILVVLVLHTLFFLSGKKIYWEETSKSVFECGFSSYFKSRYSFSVHYYLIALIFLFLDLEICFLLPYFNEETNSLSASYFFGFFSFILTLGLVLEWKKGMIEWKS